MFPEIGEVFDGTVSAVSQYGVFVDRPAGGTGLLFGESDQVGATVRVTVLAVDRERQRFSLARA